MKYITTLKNVYDTDVDNAGRRAVDLAALSRRRFNVPMGFVVTAQALEEFVNHNRLQEKGQEFLANDDYESLQKAALRGDIPHKVMEEITEGYETLAIGQEAEAHDIVDAEKTDTTVLVIPSPNYTLRNEDYSGIYQNVHGLGDLIQALKSAWSSLFTRESFAYRKEKGIKEFYSGVMILKQPRPEVSAQAMASPDNNTIPVETWFGYPDLGMGVEKDRFSVSKDPLRITNHEVNHQLKRVAKNEKGDLEKFPMEERGKQQKTDDKTIVELARLAKKMMIQFNHGTQATYSLDKENNITLLMVDRLGEAEGREGTERQEVPEAPEENESFGEPKPTPDYEQKPAGLGQSTGLDEEQDVEEKQGGDVREEAPDELPDDFSVSDEEQDDFMKELEKAQESMEPPEYSREPVSDDEEHYEPYEEDDDKEEPAPEWTEEPERDKQEESDWAAEPDESVPEIDEQEKTDEESTERDDDRKQYWDESVEAVEAAVSEEPETVTEETVDEEPEEEFHASKGLAKIKDLVHELDDLIDQGKSEEVRQKLEEMDGIVGKIRHHHG